jgi:hypothetical protein
MAEMGHVCLSGLTEVGEPHSSCLKTVPCTDITDDYERSIGTFRAIT